MRVAVTGQARRVGLPVTAEGAAATIAPVPSCSTQATSGGGIGLVGRQPAGAMAHARHAIQAHEVVDRAMRSLARALPPGFQKSATEKIGSLTPWW